MALIKPVVTYALATVFVLWVLLGAVTLPNANRWFKGADYSIQEDIISFKLSTNNGSVSMSDATAEKSGNREFKLNVYPIDNTPDVPTSGLQGVLYDRGDSCTTANIDPKIIPMPDFIKQHHNISRIALIRQSRDCYLIDKILNAQLDGAIGAIIFHNVSLDSDDPSAKFNGMGVPAKIVGIPAFYMDLNSGLILLKDLETLFKAYGSKSQGFSDRMVRVTLLPNTKPVLDHWQFALVIVGVMLITSIIAISALQCHMWQMAQSRSSSVATFTTSENETLTNDEHRQLTMDENFWRGIIGQPPQQYAPERPKRKQRMNQALVSLLPTRIYGEKETAEIEIKDHQCMSEKPNSIRNVSVDSFGTTCELSSCVICLDSFASGDILRRLPCNHEYHRDCIDVWLTKKSACCPLCQQAIEVPTVPDEAHSRTAEEARMYQSMPDLAETWSGMLQDEQVAMHQAPLASHRNQPQPNSQLQRSPENHQTGAMNPYPPM